MLCEFENDLMPRSLALKKIWKEESYFTARSMDVYITKLRKHLSSDPSISIETFHSNGYMLKTC
jgi:DNA-binding response OmpR family regulator